MNNLDIFTGVASADKLALVIVNVRYPSGHQTYRHWWKNRLSGLELSLAFVWLHEVEDLGARRLCNQRGA